VPIVLRRGSGTALGLGRIVERAVGIAREDEGMTNVVVHSTLGGWDSQDAKCELHISLTRPFFLRAYQREEMKRAVRDVARAHPP
jgi:RNase P protein component